MTELIGLYSFGIKLRREQKPITLTDENKEKIMDKFERMERFQLNAIAPLTALERMIDEVQDRRENTKCDNQRIVMFCGKCGPTSKLHKNVKLDYVCAKLTKYGIILDVIQVSHSHRPNCDLEKLCKINNGKYFTPSNNKKEWDSVVTCDNFVFPHKRSIGVEDAIDLISD